MHGDLGCPDVSREVLKTMEKETVEQEKRSICKGQRNSKERKKKVDGVAKQIQEQEDEEVEPRNHPIHLDSLLRMAPKQWHSSSRGIPQCVH
jgi:hypothetical protein